MVVDVMDSLKAVVKKHWGYTTLRPLQHEAMTAAVNGRDSLVVLPTGGGKSLCYQAPVLVSEKLTVVVSPLIALMKDQVDQLIMRGIPAAFFNSSLDAGDRRRVTMGIADGQYKLIFVAPERFGDSRFFDLLGEVGVGSFAIDEAHCISHWGHDFRSDYRKLGQLDQRFPDASVHAFTATATPRVREDIITQLGLRDPAVLVGNFFRPNLHYRAVRRTGAFQDVLGVIRDRPGQAGIVYCIRRDDVDELAAQLKSAGVRAVGYHAGMTDVDRTQAQDAFAVGEVDVVVATVAFGMGIDRADIRYVIHAAMPKSLEHYQQETGRAGRDGEPAECILFYSGGDFGLWQAIIEKTESTDRDNKLRMLSDMYHFCTSVSCRHRRLVNYFGQTWDRDSCDACDVCGGTLDTVPDSTVMSQKILSCVVRTGERFGGGHVADVLRGTRTDRVIERCDDELSTFGLIPDRPKGVLMAWMDQLVDQGVLARDGEYRVLKVTAKGWQVLRSQAEAILSEMGRRRPQKKRKRVRGLEAKTSARPGVTVEDPAVAAASEHLDREALALFERLRTVRRSIADERNVPAFVVFSDKTLREMARYRPASEDGMLAIHGVGPAKYESFGPRFLEVIQSHVSQSPRTSSPQRR